MSQRGVRAGSGGRIPHWLRLIGAALGFTAVINAVGFSMMMMSTDFDARVPLGISGVVACGLAWASGARTTRGAVLRGIGGGVAIATAALLAWTYGLGVGSAIGPWTWLPDWVAGPQLDLEDGAAWHRFSIAVAAPFEVFDSWTLMLSGVTAAALLGGVARAVRQRPARPWQWLVLAIPFAAGAASGLVDGEFAVVAVAAASGAWLALVLLVGRPAPVVESPTPEPSPVPA